MSFRSKIIVWTHTHTQRSVAVPGPLKWFVKIFIYLEILAASSAV